MQLLPSKLVPLLLIFIFVVSCTQSFTPTPFTLAFDPLVRSGSPALGTSRPRGSRSLGDKINPPALGDLPSGRSPFSSSHLRLKSPLPSKQIFVL